MTDYEEISCPDCGKHLRVPGNLGILKVRCPRCNHSFVWGHLPETRGFGGLKLLGAFAIFVLVVLAIYGLSGTKKSESRSDDVESNTYGSLDERKPDLPRAREEGKYSVSPQPTPPGLHDSSSKPTPADWRSPRRTMIPVSYGGLVDTTQITQSGQPLGEVLGQIEKRPHLRGSVQPFLAPYSALLKHVLDMQQPPPAKPFVEVERVFVAGAEQPAWAAILRGGRVKVLFDGQGCARVFLPGESPRESYQQNYGIVRHVLAGLLACCETPDLTVEVYAYENDYAKQELRLNPAPHIFTATDFAKPSGKAALDLVGLETFFERQGVLEGGELSSSQGLALLATRTSKEAGRPFPPTIADLAVVYRAVFHAGDNEAFVSLDPHSDPTKVTVSFGGMLEDTRAGSVVLEADKRFKTVTSGLDPNSMRDIRARVRGRIPLFVTSAERSLTSAYFGGDAKWRGTRFWYYPESIVVDADLDYSYAVIRQAQFTADVERSRSDFESPEKFEQLKAETVSPSIRSSIDHLNTRYSQYSLAFSELRDLDSVARLFGICVWLKRADVAGIDLDALLSVVLPPYRTERERVQLVASSQVSVPARDTVDADRPIGQSTVTSHTEQLKRSVREVFRSWSGIAEYLCIADAVSPENADRYEAKARLIYVEHGSNPVSTIIGSKRELKALAGYLAHQVRVPLPRASEQLNALIEEQKSRLEILEGRIKQARVALDVPVDRTSQLAVDAYNRKVRSCNELVRQYEALRQDFNANVEKHNSVKLSTRSVIEIGGGIGLRPKNFTVNKGTRSPELQALDRARGRVRTDWTDIGDGSMWVRSRSIPQGSSLAAPTIGRQWKGNSRRSEADGTTATFRSSDDEAYWLKSSGKAGVWRDQTVTSDGTIQHRIGDPSKGVLHVAKHRAGKMESYIVGTKRGDGRIVFTKSSRTDVLAPTSPPAWYKP